MQLKHVTYIGKLRMELQRVTLNSNLQRQFIQVPWKCNLKHNLAVLLQTVLLKVMLTDNFKGNVTTYLYRYL